ncbi:hypothetical protein ACFLWK_01375 [Chloroflexota bacterium]
MNVDLKKLPQEILFSPEFNEIFPNTFNSIIFEYQQDINIIELIDTMEARKEENVKLKYPPDCTECTLFLSKLTETIRIEPRSFSIISNMALEPRKLLKRLMVAHKLLAGYGNILQLPPPQ